MASTSSSGHDEVMFTNISGQVSEGSVLGDDGTIPSHEHIRDTEHAAVSTTIVMDPRNKFHSLVIWLLGLLQNIGGIFSCLLTQPEEHDRVDDLTEYGMNHEPEVNSVGSSNIPESTNDLEPKHKVFLSHSGAQKDFVEQLCVDLERFDRYPFFDKLQSSLPVGEKFPKRIFDAIEQCQVGVVVLSEEYFIRSKWPMLELNAMVNETKKPNSHLKIIPLLYLISTNGLKNPKNHKRWEAQWRKWAMEDKRINVEEWKRALRTLWAISGLVMKVGMGEVKFREEIVAVVCKLVPPEITWDDSHIEGCSRLCEIIQYKMNQVSRRSKICVVGLYGVGGIGKTTIGKALCNKLYEEFHDNVCHIELGSVPQMDLLRKALEKFTKKSNVVLDKLDDISQGFSYFKKHLSRQRVFLVVDNVQDNFKSIEESRMYLKGDYEQGSIILVVARTLVILKKLNLDESNIFEMPELVEVEARALFLKSLTFAITNDENEALIKNSIRRCYFLKGNGKNRHYHPLALKVLGHQIDSNPIIWTIQLKKIDTFNQLGDPMHPIFSIFKNAFISLEHEHQLVFMDLVLLFHGMGVWPVQWTILDWLCMVHRESVEDMKYVLEILMRKSLLGELDKTFTKIGIHDLWFEFAILETKSQDFKNWIYHVDGKGITTLDSNQQRKESVSRMCFSNWGWKNLEGLKLVDFANLVAFTLVVEIHMKDDLLDLDLSGLKHLKSIEIYTPGLKVRPKGLSSLTSLGELLWHVLDISQCLDGIMHLTELRYLKIYDCKGIKVLDFTKLKLLQVVKIFKFPDLISVTGLSSKLANLQILQINKCNSLRQCHGLNELCALEILDLSKCMKLEELPYLGQLINLKELDIAHCKSLSKVQGFSDLVALEKFCANGCSKLATLFDVIELAKLQVLDIRGCLKEGTKDLDHLVALATFRGSFTKISKVQPIFSNLLGLKVLDISGWNGPIWTSIQNLLMLEELELSDSNGEELVLSDSNGEELAPDLQNLKKLRHICLFFCHNMDLLGLRNVISLKDLTIAGCSKIKLPEFKKLIQLKFLCIKSCHDLISIPSASDLDLLETLSTDEYSLMKNVYDLKTLTSLQSLILWYSGCSNIILNMASLGEQLEYLYIGYYTRDQIISSPRPKEVHLPFYSSLKILTCNTPLTTLNELTVEDCVNLVEIPDLAMFPHLETLHLKNCKALKKLTCSTPLIAMKKIKLIGCNRELEILDLNMFPKLEMFKVKKSFL